MQIQIQEAVSWMCSVKKVFLEISKNSQEDTCARVSFLNKVFLNFLVFHHIFLTFEMKTN